MTRVTFRVSASAFVANMCVKQNAVDLALKYPLAARVVDESYVDDGLTGTDTVDEAIELHDQLQSLFSEVDSYFTNGIRANQEYYNASSPNFKILSLSTLCQNQRSILRLWALNGTLGWISFT